MFFFSSEGIPCFFKRFFFVFLFFPGNLGFSIGIKILVFFWWFSLPFSKRRNEERKDRVGHDASITASVMPRCGELSLCAPEALEASFWSNFPKFARDPLYAILSGTELAILNRESSDSESGDSNRAIPRSL